ncbi:MAG: response regulator [Bacteroidetes bacterium]|nr:response regulator [Bacteroidota bacterium]MBU2585512.1 response regulator [Bacteroidota bacterium]
MSENNHSAKPKILYVEDHLESANLIVLILKKDFDVSIAESVEQALEKLKSEKFNLILMDIQLQSKFDGLELIKKLKSDEKYKNIPVIALTAHAIHGDKEKMINGGADDYIAKPFNKAVLIKRIPRSLLRGQKDVVLLHGRTYNKEA